MAGIGERFISAIGTAGAAAHNALGSQIFVALSALCLVMLTSQALFAPTRMPPVGPIPLAQLGLAPAIPEPDLLPQVKDQIDAAVRAATPYAVDALMQAKANEDLARAVNYGGAGASLVLTLLGLFIQRRKAMLAAV